MPLACALLLNIGVMRFNHILQDYVIGTGAITRCPGDSEVHWWRGTDMIPYICAVLYCRICLLTNVWFALPQESTFQIVLVTDGESDALVFLSFDKVNIDLDNGLCSRVSCKIHPLLLI